jgi:hypothetical protein
MKARTLIAGLTLAAALPMTASAVVPTIHGKSLESCEDAIRNELGRSQVTDTFHRQRDDGRHEIYANVLKYEGGELVPMRVTCQTSTSGRRVMDLQAQAGRWIESEGRG